MEQQDSPAYLLFDIVAHKDVRVCFEPLIEADRAELRSVRWQNARFRDVWDEWVGLGLVLKLTLCDGLERPLLGMVRTGTVQRFNGIGGALRDSLLEAAPEHQYGVQGRRYRGIGRVLVAHLVRESRQQGAKGRLFVRPVRSSIPFYRKLGFKPIQDGPYYVLQEQEASEILRTYT